jgi:hypothetical protein
LKRTQALQAAFPASFTSAIDGGVRRLFGASLSTGATPAASAQAFQRAYAAALGIDPSELVPQEMKRGRALASSVPQAIGLMYDQSTGQPRFWLHRAGQSKNGVNVYRAGVLTLVRNAADNPVVWSSSSLRDLSAFTPPVGLQARAPDGNKSLASIRGTSDFAGSQVAGPQAITSLSQPELVVFAGTEDHEVAPRMAIQYTAETAPSGKWHFVADASTGEVLHVESLVMFDAITGNVAGMATPGEAAIECAAPVSTPFPFAEVDCSDCEGAFAGPDGAYLLGGFSGTVTVTSPMVGMYFHVASADPNVPVESPLTTSVTPPVTTADFLHNPAGTDDEVTAQANAYVQANLIRLFLLKYLPSYPSIPGYPSDKPPVFSQTGFLLGVNLSKTDWDKCPANAAYTYDPNQPRMDFCKAGLGTVNKAFASVIHHEYGHNIVQMGGSGQGMYGEGMADTVAFLYSGDSRMGLGWNVNQCTTGVRDANNNCMHVTPSAACSTCESSVDLDHSCGMLLSGIIWSIRENLRLTNPSTFVELINNLVLSSIPLHSGEGINSQIAIDLLTLDDDDGNIYNGTPHSTEICNGFAAHGLTCPGVVTDLVVSPLSTFSAEGPVGGPFTPTSMNYQVSNLGPNSNIQYQATAAPATTWFSVSASAGFGGPGVLSMGQPLQVNVAINGSVAAGLPKGEYDGVVQFTNATNGVGNTTRAVHLTVGIQPTFTETFDGGLGSFTVGSEPTNLWHLGAGCESTVPGHSPPNSLYFGSESSCTYNNGQVAAGTVTSGPITIADPSVVKLRFKYALETEHKAHHDQASAQVSVNGGAFVVVASNDATQGGVALTDGGTGGMGWLSADVDLSPLLVSLSSLSDISGLSSPTVRVRFAFDSVDSQLNAYMGFAVDDIQIVQLVGPPVNKAPVVNAGPDLTVFLTPAATLAGTVTDDGLPNPPGKVTITWSKVSGPGTVTFANAKLAATTATFSKTGSYVLRLTGNDGTLSASDDVTVTVTTNKAPVVNAGPDQTVALSVPTSLAGTATDDGLPNPPGKVTATWSKVSGPGTVTFANKNALSTTATFSVVGAYVLRLTGNDGSLSGTDDVAITVSTPCAGLCSNPTIFTINGSYQSGNLGTGAVCRETTSALAGGNCGNLVSPRVLKVNGTTEPCTGLNWTSVPAKRNGGYCVQTTTGNQSYAFFAAW